MDEPGGRGNFGENEMKKYWYSIKFIGRKQGAIGVTYEITDVVEANILLTMDEAVLGLYDRYEMVSSADVVDMGVNTKGQALSKNKSHRAKGDL